MKNVLYLLAFISLGSASLTAQCSISNLTYDELLCENDGLIVFYGIDFDTMDVSSAFQIFINGELQYSSFAYDLPFVGIEFSCPGSEQFDFKICDLEDTDCCVEAVLDHPCFDICDGCSIYEFYNNTDLVCENDQMVAEWFIHSENTSQIGYDIFLEGEFLTFVEYVAGSGPYFFDVPAVESEYFTLTACDTDNPDCCFSWAALNPCFSEELACSIVELYAEPLFCDDETFDVQIGFEYENTSATFEIIINDIVYGVYNYADLPINLLGIEVDCELQYEFVVLDSEDEDCSAIVGYEVECCENLQCDIFSIDFGDSPICENNQIVSEWFIFSENTSEVGFDISINDDFLLFVEFDGEGPYAFDIPDPETEFYTLTACDSEDADCCYSWELENPCYEGGSDCAINDLNAEVTVCEENLFDVEITFNHGNASDSFSIVGNGNNYGTFAYADLPVILTSLSADCELDYEFVIIDSEDGDCAADTGIGIVCCENLECDIFSIDFGDSPICENNQIVSEWFIFSENTSEVGFDISINDDFLLFVEFDGEGPYAFDIPNPETELFTITACDNDNADCCYSWELENPCYEGGSDCAINDLNAEVTVCEENLFDVEITFNHGNPSDSFSIVGNGNNYGTFAYADLPVILTSLSADCELDYEFVIIDSEDGDCAADTGIGIVCCQNLECDIFSIDFGDSPICENNQIVYEWFIFSENTSEVGFDISINDDFLLFVEFDGEGPYAFDIPDPETELFTITACDNDNADCCYSWELENPCYEGGSDCAINDLNAEVTVCEENLFDVEITFNHGNPSDSFSIVGNGNNYGTFAYADLPVVLTSLAADCELDYEFVVIDSEDGDCAADTGIGTVCCDGMECSITNIEFEGLSCEGGLVLAEWYIIGENVSEAGYDIFVDGEFIQFVQYNGDGPYAIEIESPGDEVFVLMACDNDNADCCNMLDIENPCYEEPQECSISEVDAEVTACEEDLFDVEITFEYDSTSDSFEILGNGNNYGTFAYTDLPVVLTSLAADCELDYEFVVIDSQDGDCTDALELGIQCCDEEDIVDNISISFPADMDTAYFLRLTMNSEKLSGCDITVYVDGELLGSYGADMEIAIGPFACADSSLVELLIVDSCTELEYTFTIDLGDYSCITSSFEPTVEVDVEWNIYNNTLTILTDTQEPLQIGVYGIDGSLIKKLQQVGRHGSYPLDFDRQGVYIVSIVDHNGYRSTFKILSVR